MFSRMKIAASTGSCSDKIKRLKNASVVIGAVVIGAGLSASAYAEFTAPCTKDTKKHRKTADLNHFFHNPARMSFRRYA